MGHSVGDLRRLQAERNKISASKSGGKSRKTTGKGNGRNVRWHSAHLYRCVREGRAFEQEREIEAAYKSGTLVEEDLCIFRHADEQTKRGEVMPLFEAVYRVGAEGRPEGGKTLWVLAQKCHLAQVYTKAGRTRADCMWDVDAEGVPYWVDRYLFRKLKQKSAKRRYEQKVK